MRTALIMITLFCFFFTVVVFTFALTNSPQVGELVRVVLLIRSQALDPPTNESLFQGAIRGVVSSMGDPYSAYLTGEQYRSLFQQISGSYGGIGLEIGLDDQGRLEVVGPFKGTPAHRAGILSGDLIIRIDGKDTRLLTLEESAQLIQGEPGTEVSLDIQRGNEQLAGQRITREKIIIPTVDGTVIPGHNDIGYINISCFSEQTPSALEQVLSDIDATKLKGLILDLRNNPGGELTSAVKVASNFVPPGPVVYTANRSETVPYLAEGNPINVPLVVLINEGTASAAEIVSGAIKDRGTGKLVGEKTFGKGRVQKVLRMSSGSALKLTTEKYLTPSHQDINGRGIEPDVTVPMSPEIEARVLLKAPDLKEDLQLQKALEML